MYELGRHPFVSICGRGRDGNVYGMEIRGFWRVERNGIGGSMGIFLVMIQRLVNSLHRGTVTIPSLNYRMQDKWIEMLTKLYPESNYTEDGKAFISVLKLTGSSF